MAALRDALVLLVAILLLLAALLMLARRLAGALEPADGATTVLAGAATAAIAAAVHLALRLSGSSRMQNASLRALDVAADVSLIAIAMSLSLPSSPAPAIVVLWLIVVGEVAWSRAPGIHSLRVSQPSRVGQAVQDEAAPWQDSTLTQHLQYRPEGGRSAVSGWLRADFVAGQRTAIVHAAFCPAFERTPHVEAEILDGDPCRIRATLIVPWGVRWELRLDEPAQHPTTTILGFTATEGVSHSPVLNPQSPFPTP